MYKIIRGGAREIIYKVLMQCMAEFQIGKLLSELDLVYKRTVDYTGKLTYLSTQNIKTYC